MCHKASVVRNDYTISPILCITCCTNTNGRLFADLNKCNKLGYYNTVLNVKTLCCLLFHSDPLNYVWWWQKYFSVFSQDNVLSINWIWFYLHSLILKVSTNHAYLVFIETLVFPHNFQGKKWNQNSKQNELIWGFRLLELSRMVPPLCNHLKWHNDMTRKICYVIVCTKLWQTPLLTATNPWAYRP